MSSNYKIETKCIQVRMAAEKRRTKSASDLSEHDIQI